MTAEPAIPGLPAPPDASLRLDDPLAAAGFGAALLAAVERMSAPAADDSAQRLVAEMGRLSHALQAQDAAAIRRSAGLWGRLLGRDVEAQAQAEQLAAQLDVCLLRADASADALQVALGAHLRHAAELDAAAGAIEHWADAGQALPPPAEDAVNEVLQRRLHHLRGVAALRRAEAAQLRLLHAQGVELVERYLRIRDVLLPLWRQHALANRAAQMPARLEQAAASQRRVLDEVTAMQARLR